MDYLNKFDKLRSTLSSSVTATVFSTISTVKDALPGNPVTREFEVEEHVASAGPGLCWKVFSGRKRSTKEPAAVFVLEKRGLEQRVPDRREREAAVDRLKRAVAQVTRLRHPQVLTVQHPLEESRDCLAFATEPVFASLANILGHHDNLPTNPPPAWLAAGSGKPYRLHEVEIKYGLLQLCEGLAFLHGSVKMLHGNLCPESVVLNEKGAWKIFGFDFCLGSSSSTSASDGAGGPTLWFRPWHGSAEVGGHEPALAARPDLDFLAPECSLDPECGPTHLTESADMYSLGMIAFTLYNDKPLFTNGGSWARFQKSANELKSFRESNLHLVPNELKGSLKLLLNVAPEIRPTASQLVQIPFFDDVGVKTLSNLDSQFQWDNLQKSQFYKGLPQILPKLPHRVALHRVVPCLAKEFVNPHMVPFVLPSVLNVAEEASKQDYVAHVLPCLKPVMKLTDPVQILLIFMQRMDMLLSKTPADDVKADVLPMIYRALESDTSQIQELCLSIIPGFAGLIDYQATKTSLLPRIKKLCLGTNLLSVRVNSLICIGKLIHHLDRWLVLDDVLPMLQQIPSREPAVIMAVVGIYKMTLAESKLGMTKEIIATKVLPFLFPLSIENGLTVTQYSAVVGLIRGLVDRVEQEHMEKLQQLDSLHSEQRNALKMSMSEQVVRGSSGAQDQLVIPAAAGPQNELDKMFSGLGLGSYVASKDTGAIATSLLEGGGGDLAGQVGSGSGMVGTPSSSHGLSLQQKQKILQDAENLKRMQGQGGLVPLAAGSSPMGGSSSSSAMKRSATVDLTTTLMMQSNLKQMSGGNGSLKMTPSYSTATMPGAMGATAPPVRQPFPTFTGGPADPRPKPDLSAFDSLMTPLPSQKSRPPMNAMPSLMSPMGGASPMTSSSLSSGLQPVLMAASKSPQPAVKALTANDINDLLS